MSKIKMVVTDLDGTLLTTGKYISVNTKRVLKLLKEQEILFVIATARPIRTVTSIFTDVSYDAGIFHNGAVILEENYNVTNIGVTSPYEMLKCILTDNPECHVAVEVEDHLYANFDAERLWPGVAYTTTSRFHEVQGKVADKLIIEVNSLERMSEYEKYLTKELYLQLSENRIAMVLNREATKIKAVEEIAKRHGIQMDEIVAFGDDYNDIDMLQGCGIGVAMGNALDEVKEAADDVCDTNDQDGMARWIEFNVLMDRKESKV